MGFPRQEPWSGLPFAPPGNLPNPGTELKSPTLQADSSPPSPAPRDLPKCRAGEERDGKRVGTLWEKPLMSTLLRASSHMSQELSFHTWVAMLYSSISGSCRGQVPSGRCTGACCPPLPGADHKAHCAPPAEGSTSPEAPQSRRPLCPRTPACLAAYRALTLVKWNCRGSSVDSETMRPRDRYSGSGFRW